MWALLLIGFVAPFVYFGYLLSKLDKFLAENERSAAENKSAPMAIVLGKTDIAKQTANILEKNGLDIYHLSEPLVNTREKGFRYVFALSENDADNIVLCMIGKKLYGIEEMISVCNDPKHESMFMTEKIHYLLAKGATAELLYKAVVQEQEVK